jgi:hypothetical protein
MYERKILRKVRNGERMDKEEEKGGNRKTKQSIGIDLKLVVCILLRVLGQVQGFCLTQHWFEYFTQ